VTVQSSTESAQEDTFLQDLHSTSQSSHTAHSNSSDSLDSSHANSLARGVPRPLQTITATPVALGREPYASVSVCVSTANACTDTLDDSRSHGHAYAHARGHSHASTGVQHDILPRPGGGGGIGIVVSKGGLLGEEPLVVPRRKLSSIGIQVGHSGGAAPGLGGFVSALS